MKNVEANSGKRPLLGVVTNRFWVIPARSTFRRLGKTGQSPRSSRWTLSMSFRVAKRCFLVIGTVLVVLIAYQRSVRPELPGGDSLQGAKRLAWLNNWTE